MQTYLKAHTSHMVLGLVSIAASVFTAPVMAETFSFEDVTVTARRVEENIQSSPVAVTALSADQLERFRIDSVQKLSSQVPGLHVATYSTPDSLVVAIRGQRNSQIQAGQDPSIGVYFNDVPTGFQVGLNLGMFDLGNVQVLKGPQGTLFGRNSTGGAVLINSASPTDIFEGSFQAGVTGFARGAGFSTTSIVNVPLDETLAMRVSVKTVNQQGWQQNIADPATIAAAVGLPAVPSFSWPHGKSRLQDLGAQDSQEWRVSLRWTPTRSIENQLVYQGANYHLNGTGPKLISILPTSSMLGTYSPILQRQLASDNFWSTQQGWNSPTSIKQHQISNTLSWDLGWMTAKHISGWKAYDRVWVGDSLGSPLSLAQNVISEHTQDAMEVSQELQFSGTSLDDQLSWVGGVFYFYNQLDQNSVGTGFGWSNRSPHALSTTLAAYAQGSYQIPQVDGLALTFGARYTMDRRALWKTQYSANLTNCSLRLAPSDATPPPGCRFDGVKKFGQWTYNLSLDYQVTPDTMIYASNSRGYRAGGLNVAESSLSNYLLGYKPETVINYELGLKRDWDLAIPLRTNLAAYLQKYTNIVRQAQNPATPLFSILTNGPKADVRGVEAEISVKPFPGMDIGLSYAYVDAQYKAPFFPFGIGNPFNAQFNEISLVPKTTLTLNASYTLPMINSDYGAVTVGGSFYHQSRFWYDDVQQRSACGSTSNQSCGGLNDYSQKPYSTLAMRLDWESVMGSNFDVNLWVTNLTNTEYYTSATPLGNVLGFSGYYGQPRFYGFDVKYRF